MKDGTRPTTAIYASQCFVILAKIMILTEVAIFAMNFCAQHVLPVDISISAPPAESLIRKVVAMLWFATSARKSSVLRAVIMLWFATSACKLSVLRTVMLFILTFVTAAKTYIL